MGRTRRRGHASCGTSAFAKIASIGAGNRQHRWSSLMEIIDAYAHCGLSKYEPIEKVRETMAAAGVSRAGLVQHLGVFDNSYIGSVVASDPQHVAGVLLVDHRQKDVVGTLERWHASGNFQGIRLTA